MVEFGNPFSHLSQNLVPKTIMELDNQDVCEGEKHVKVIVVKKLS